MSVIGIIISAICFFVAGYFVGLRTNLKTRLFHYNQWNKEFVDICGKEERKPHVFNMITEVVSKIQNQKSTNRTHGEIFDIAAIDKWKREMHEKHPEIKPLTFDSITPRQFEEFHEDRGPLGC